VPNKLTQIRIILLHTFHPGNIGAAARAMKTMGLQELVLVNPDNFPHSEATSRAAGAKDILENLVIVDSLEEAIADCNQVFATSARQPHSFTRPSLSAEEVAEWINENQAEKIAIVFGGERDGMSRDEINLCQQILYIPGNEEYCVLNVSAAVQIVCYELFKRLAANENTTIIGSPVLASQKDLNNFYAHLEDLLTERQYIRPEQKSDSMVKLRSFINRAQPTSADIGLLRGMIKALSRQI